MNHLVNFSSHTLNCMFFFGGYIMLYTCTYGYIRYTSFYRHPAIPILARFGKKRYVLKKPDDPVESIARVEMNVPPDWGIWENLDGTTIFWRAPLQRKLQRTSKISKSAWSIVLMKDIYIYIIYILYIYYIYIIYIYIIYIY